MRRDYAVFETQTDLPSSASFGELSKIGARYFFNEGFVFNGVPSVYEQMQLARDDGSFMWKRIVPSDLVKELSGSPFVIHYSILGERAKYYPDKEEVREKVEVAFINSN